MPTWSKSLGAALAFVVLLLFAAAGSIWWSLERALPQLDGTAGLEGLRAEVSVERDAWGVPHIRAQSIEDLVLAQGYVMAQDRLWQMDLLRRAAAGTLAEIFGPVALEHDRENRALGFQRAAEAAVARMPEERRRLLEAYARGVNLYMEQRRGRLPAEFLALRYSPQPWTPADTLLIAANLYKELTGFWKDQMLRAEVSRAVGAEMANDLYAATANSPWDHPIVGLGTAPGKAAGGAPRAFPQGKAPGVAADAGLTRIAPESPWTAADGPLPLFGQTSRSAGGSNNWVIGGAMTATGKAMLANDTHLGWAVPCIWYLVHLTAPGWNVKGFALPGAPLVVIGHNEHIAWGFTNNFADVQDVYIETFNPENPLEYRVNGAWQKAEVRHEVIRVRGQADQLFDVLVTRHGPVVLRDNSRGYAIRWTATEPGGLDATYFLLGQAKNWPEFVELIRQTPGPAQNAVYADVEGHIGYVVAAKVPIRRTPADGVPVPGDTDAHEWTGYIPVEDLPSRFDPPEGVMATANARVVGPAYPWYLTDNWMAPYRTARIYELLGERKSLRPADFINIQTDTYSYPDVLLARELRQARDKVAARDPRARQMLGMLDGWNGDASVDSVPMSFLEFTRRALLVNLLRKPLGPRIRQYQWMRSSVFLENVLRERPARWLPTEFKSYDELLISSADLAVEKMMEASHHPEVREWAWGVFNVLRMNHPLGRTGILERALSIGPVPISGSEFSVKQITPTFGPSMRFVADLSNFDNSLMNVTSGESGQFRSANYRDQFPAWYQGRGIPSAFTDAAEESRVAHRLRLVPAASR